MDVGELVMSEVHLGCPPGFSGTYATHFSFPLPSKAEVIDHKLISLDTDGDLVLARRKRDKEHKEFQSFDSVVEADLTLSRERKSYVTESIGTMTVQHSIMSSLSDVGLQVWMAALLLSDYLLHISFISSELDNIIALELGSGTGLVGIVLARFAKKVFLTDYGNEVLSNCAKNIQLSLSSSELNEASIHIRELDWKESWPPHVNTRKRSKYSWMAAEIEEAEGVSLILAADVIYCDELTESLFNVLEKLMSRGSEKVLYLALEKRFNFSINDLDVVANGYTRFLSFFKNEEDCKISNYVSFPCFVGEKIDIFKIPQYIREYERSRDLELWRIRYCKGRSQLSD